MVQYIKSLEIRGFRTLSNLNISKIGGVNLITGKNNSGKSSVLEAIRILASGGSLKTLSDILRYREELLFDRTEMEESWKFTDATPVSNLFTGFPSIGSGNGVFSISSKADFEGFFDSVSVTLGIYSRRVSDERVIYSEILPGSDLTDGEILPALAVRTANTRRIVPLNRFYRRARSDIESQSKPCIYVDPFSSRSSNEMGALWDAIALTDLEPEIVKALQIVSKDILGVSIIGGGDRLGTRTAIAKSAGFSSPVPLRTFGDGVNRLFGIILSLCTAKGGILLIDEIENGLHHSAQLEVWRTIFRLAETLKVQVFATSHSYDCVQAFQKAAIESPALGALFRLSKLKDRVVSTSFSELELQIATRDQIEVR
jgi:hypothetical protein